MRRPVKVSPMARQIIDAARRGDLARAERLIRSLKFAPPRAVAAGRDGRRKRAPRRWPPSHPLDAGRSRSSTTSQPSWLLPAAAYRPDPENFYAQRSARHEGAHAAAAHLLGWEVTGAELHANGGGYCYVLAPANLDRTRSAREYAVILYVARAHAGWSASDSYASDDRQAYQAIERLIGEPAQVAATLDALRAQADQLEASQRFRWIAGRVAAALLERGKLDATELGPLLRDSARDARRVEHGLAV